MQEQGLYRTISMGSAIRGEECQHDPGQLLVELEQATQSLHGCLVLGMHKVRILLTSLQASANVVERMF